MPITVLTGQPGNGKTLLMMERLEKALDEAKRPIYVHGVTGPLPMRANKLEDPRDWEKCPDGSLIFIDEAWRGFGHLQDARGAPTPAHVQALATHRHRGMDFVMTTQLTNQLYPFMRGLIGEHTHVVRKFGTPLCTLYTWGELNEDVKSATQREKAVSVPWVQPARLFGQYDSATEHTIKAKIPWRVFLIPVAIVLASLCLWYAYMKLVAYGGEREADVASLQADSGEAGTASESNGERKRSEPLTDAEWVKRLTPRFAGVHGSQPIFDDREVLSQPRTYCVMRKEVDYDACTCYTEQATKIKDILYSACREMALEGQYDPFRAPMQAGVPVQFVPKEQEQPPPAGLGESFDRPLVIPGAISLP